MESCLLFILTSVFTLVMFYSMSDLNSFHWTNYWIVCRWVKCQQNRSTEKGRGNHHPEGPTVWRPETDRGPVQNGGRPAG